MEHFLVKLVSAYPQLALPISEDTRSSEDYRNSVLRGVPAAAAPDFSFSPLDVFSVEDTPAGPVRVLSFYERTDFEHAYRALACRCAPVAIPPSTGAVMISGLINWDTINRRRDEYLSSGGSDWASEFSRFTSDKQNYTDSIILLSSGPYSDVSADAVCVDPERWTALSVTIRKFHELTHFVCRRLHPDNIDALRDEIIADLIGICAAVGFYDTHMARVFLGIEGSSFRPGGRLVNYIQLDQVEVAAKRADALIDLYKPVADSCGVDDLFSLLEAVFSLSY